MTKMRSDDADLRRRQTDAGRGVHRLDHVVDERLDLGRDGRRPRRAGACSASARRRRRIGRISQARGSGAGRSAAPPSARGRRPARWRVDERPPSRRRSRSSSASASTRATMASPTTAAAGTAQTSLRSMAAGDSARCVARSTERSGFISVADRLHVAGDAHVFAVGDAALEAAGVVGRPRHRAVPAARRRRQQSRRGPASPGRAALPAPRPMPTALMAGIDISACASRPSSLRSHCT